MANSWSPNKARPSTQPLQLWLALRIALAGVLPLVAVAALALFVLLPRLRSDLEIQHQTLAHAIAGQIEAHLLGARRELRAIAAHLRHHSDQPVSFWLGDLVAHAGTGDVFAAIYIADSDDSVYAVGLPQTQRGQQDNLLGLDLSQQLFLREARRRNEEVWSETFLSTVSGRLAVSLAVPVASQVLIGEIAIDQLSEFIGHLPTGPAMLTMVLDRRGQIIAHSQPALSGQQFNLNHLSIIRDALQGRFTTQNFKLDDETLIGTVVSIAQLGWTVLVAQPRVEAFQPFLSTLWALTAGALVALLLVILVPWTLARSFSRRIGRYAEQAHAMAEGDYDQPWPVSHIREFASLAGDLERMSLAIRQREHDLATSEARYRSVISNAPVIIFQFDERGIITLNEGKGLTRVGLAPGKAVGQSLFKLYRNYPQVCEYARRAISGESLYFTSEIRNTVFDVYFNPMREGDGPVQVMGVAVDITERQRAEEALRQANLVVENSPVILFRWKAKEGWPVAFVSQNVKQLGYSPEKLLDGSIHFASMVYPEDLERIVHEVRGYSERGVDQFQQEYRIVTNNGAVRWVDDRTVVERNAEGQITHYQGIVIDITDRKRAEEELQQHRDHLEELVAARTAELRQAMHQLVQSEKLAALGHLVAGVAHELNTPLGNTRVVASTLGEDVRAFEAAIESGALRRSQVNAFLNRSREAVELLERNTARAADLIGHFKQVAVDQSSARRRRFDLRQTVEEMLVTLRPQFKHTAHRIEIDIPPGLELDSYPGPLEQVLANLIGNSLAHGFAGLEAGCCIQLQAQGNDPTQVVLRCADNGIGIPDAILNHIFEPFFTTRLGQGGSGLGLYIVYNLVTSVLGGAIQVDSSPGHGATFTLTLPRTAPDHPTLEPPA